MSFLVTRPPVPVPGISAISTPCSSARRRTTGEGRVSRRVSASSISPRPSPSLSAGTATRCLSLPCATGWASVPEAGHSFVGDSAASVSCREGFVDLHLVAFGLQPAGYGALRHALAELRHRHRFGHGILLFAMV